MVPRERALAVEKAEPRRGGTERGLPLTSGDQKRAHSTRRGAPQNTAARKLATREDTPAKTWSMPQCGRGQGGAGFV